MDKRVNQGYVITDQIQVGNKVFVLGESQTAPSKFVTWQSYADNVNSYDWGHYKDSRISALEDMCKRALSEIENVKVYENPLDMDLYETHRDFIEANGFELNKAKIYIYPDKENVVVAYFNPDCNTGGQIVYNSVSYQTLKELFSECNTVDSFWERFDERASQTISDMGTADFTVDAKAFIENPCHYIGCGTETTNALKNLVIDHDIEKRWESYTPIGKALALEMYDKGKKIYIDYDLAKSRREIENAAEDGLKSPDVKRYQKEQANKKRHKPDKER